MNANLEGDLVVADLHCHTKKSDGSTGIDELIYIAKKMNVKMCDNPDRLLGLSKKTGENTQKAAARMLQKAMRLYPISPEMVSKKAQGSTNVFKHHIMQAIMDAGYSTPDYNNMFEKLFNPASGIVYTKTEYPAAEDVIAQIHSAGGVAVLAHPNLYDNVELIKELTVKGLDGVEVWSPSANEEQTKELYEIAKGNNLIITGGSDFHGMYSKSKCPIGTCTTPLEQIEKLKKRKVEICKSI